MKTRLLLLIASCVFLAVARHGAADDRVERLSEEHRKWLQEEVVYIITEREQETFLSLETLETFERVSTDDLWRDRSEIKPRLPSSDARGPEVKCLEQPHTAEP